jgi:ribose transport system ATP-binding protein
VSEPALRLEGVTKRFGRVTALEDVSLEVRPHEVVGLVGENGAGKSTLFNILSGIHSPDAGRMFVHGAERSFRTIADSRRAGIGMVFQEQSLVPNVSVAENVFLGNEGASVRFGCYRWPDLRGRAQRQLDTIASPVSPAALTEDLPFSQRQMVEVAKALTVEEQIDHPPILLLDEPTSVLEGHEIEVLFAQIERLKEVGSVVFVSHRLDEVLRVSDRIYVMRDGKCVAERRPAECDHRELFELMVGQQFSDAYYQEDAQRPFEERVTLSVRGVTSKGDYDDVSFDLHAGEVLGLAGVLGSGRDELCRTLFGADAHDGGQILLDGEPVSFASPAEAAAAGIAYLPAERKIEGIVGDLSVAENIGLARDGERGRFGLVNRRREREVAEQWIERLSIKAPSASATVGQLSGGNQQKVALAKWLNRPNLRLIILDHPTRGLDVGAKRDVYTLMRELSGRGVAILLTADSLEETIALSHNVITMRDGRVTRVFGAPAGAKPQQVDLMAEMV